MPNDSVQDSTRYVISDVHHGSVLPGERLEMDRDVYLRPGADIRGGIWSDHLEVAGPDVEVADSVYSQSAVAVTRSDDAEKSSGDDVTFGACLTTPDTLLVDPSGFKARFLSDLYAERANLSGSFVFGNVYARGAVIRDSIILGGIFCKGKLELSNCFVHTFQARRAEIGEDVSIFAPFALAHESIDLEAPVSSVTFADVFQKDDLLETTRSEETSLSSEEEMSEDVVQLYEEDIFEIQAETQSPVGDGAPATQTVLSMTERILDSSLVQERLQRNKEILRRLSLDRHIDSTEQGSTAVAELEEVLWKKVESRSSEDSEGRPSASLQSLFERFGLGD